MLKEDENGNWKFYQVYEDRLTIPFLGYRQEESITLNDPGNYAVFLSGKAGVGVLAGAGLEVIGDTVLDYNNPESVSGEISGNVLTDVNNFGSEFGQDIYDKENITVTKVTITRDLSIARGYMSLFATGGNKISIEDLRQQSREIRYTLGTRI